MGFTARIISRTVALAPIKRTVLGGRVGTLHTSLEDFASRVGNPHEAAPREHWRNYSGHDLIDGAGKVSAIWHLDTPRGPVEIGDYWWNNPEELSIRAKDMRAKLWAVRWLKHHGFKAD